MKENREFCDPDIVFQKVKLIRKTLGEPDDVCVNVLTSLLIVASEGACILGVKKSFFLKMTSEIWDKIEFQLERDQEE